MHDFTPGPKGKSRTQRRWPQREKADLIAALKAASAYCDKAYDGMTDASATETVKLMMSDMPKLFALTANNLHSIAHYGNLITYLRMKDLVPPSSDPEFMRQAMK